MRPYRAGTVGLALLLGVLAYQRLAALDSRFVNIASLSGARALASYLLGDYAGAAEAYRRDLATRLTDSRYATPPAALALLKGDLEVAHRDALEALRAGRVRDGYLTLGEVALARGRHQEAIDALNALLTIDVDQFDALLLKAIAQVRLGQDGAAIQSLNLALRHDRVETRPTVFLSTLSLIGDLASRPDAQRPACLLATLHRYLRIYDAAQASAAIRYAERAIAAADHPADAYYTLGIVHFRQNHHARALASFRAAVTAEPRHAIALVGAAHLHGLRGDLAEKDELMTAAFAAAPHDQWIADAFEVHLREIGDYQRAIDLGLQQTAAAPRDVRAWWRLSTLYLELGEAAPAMETVERGLAVAPNDLSLHENRAMALATADRMDEAFAEYRSILAADPVNRVAHHGIALLHRKAQRYADARRSYEMLLATGQMDSVAYGGYCEILLLLKEGAASEACLTRILRYDPENVAAKSNLGVARRMRGR